MPGLEIQKLVHELQVRQMELEVQNEELRKTQLELEDSRDRYLDLYDLAPIGCLTLDRTGLILEANRTAATLLGVERVLLIGKKLSHFVCRSNRKALRRHCDEVLSTGQRQACELQFEKLDGTLLQAQLDTVAVRDDALEMRCRTAITDVTALKRADEALADALEESRQRAVETAALLEGVRAVLECHEFQDAARRIFDSCKNVTGAAAGYVALLSADGTENEVLYLDAGGLPCTVPPDLPMPIRGLRAQAYRTNEVVYHNTFSGSEWQQLMPRGHVALESVLFAPLSIRGQIVGLLGLGNKPGGFTDNDARLAKLFGEFASVALHNSRTLESLETSERRFRAVAETANDAIVSSDFAGNIVFWNAAAETIFGYSPDEIIGQPLTVIMPERFRNAHQQAVGNLRAVGGAKVGDRTKEMLGLRKDGSEFAIELSISAWKSSGDSFFTGIIRDITERKGAEEALRQAHRELEDRVQQRTAELLAANERLKQEIAERQRVEAALRLDDTRLEALVKLNDMADAPVGQVADFALEEAVKVTRSSVGFLGFVNRDESQLTMHGWSEAAMRKCRVDDTPKTFRIAEGGLWGETVRLRRPIVVNDYAAPRAAKKGFPQGHVGIRRFLGIPVLEHDRVVAVAAVANKENDYEEGDIRQLTLLMGGLWRLIQRRQTQQALRESEQRLQAILDNATAVVFLKDTEGRYVLVNRRFEQLCDLARDEIVGKTDLDLWPQEQADRYRLNDKQVLEARAPLEFEELARQDDGLHTYLSIKFPLSDAAGTPYAVCGISTDITERKRAEEKIRRTERLASLGTFAAGIAHEINNPLAAILMGARHACRAENDSAARETALNEIIEDVERCTQIVKRILHFARQGFNEREHVDPNDIARGAVRITRGYAEQRRIRLELGLTPDLPVVDANLFDLQQACVNVIHNSVEASEPGQIIVVRTEQNGPNVLIRVRDDGRGMTIEERQRAFDPFFTTRARDGGTGLGLSMVHGMVSAHGGTVKLDSSPGQGTTVTIELRGCGAKDGGGDS